MPGVDPHVPRILWIEHEENWDDWLCQGWVWRIPKKQGKSPKKQGLVPNPRIPGKEKETLKKAKKSLERNKQGNLKEQGREDKGKFLFFFVFGGWIFFVFPCWQFLAFRGRTFPLFARTWTAWQGIKILASLVVFV